MVPLTRKVISQGKLIVCVTERGQVPLPDPEISNVEQLQVDKVVIIIEAGASSLS